MTTANLQSEAIRSTPLSPSGDHSWWASLRHGGCLIAPSRLAEFFPSAPAEPLPSWQTDRLRRAVVRLKEDNDKPALDRLLDTVLLGLLGLGADSWRAGVNVGEEWSAKALTGEVLKPRRIWQDPRGGVLPVFIADESAAGPRAKTPALGLGRGRRSVARVIEWLRRANQKIAVLTNGHQWRLIHAGPDYDAWCEWDTDAWFVEGEPGPQVDALRLLLGKESVAGVSPAEDRRQDACATQPPLIAAILATRRGQADLSSALGERVRQAVELLLRESRQALEQITTSSQLPSDQSDPSHQSDPSTALPPPTLRETYIAACRLVMRLVVILFAESRKISDADHLLPLGNPIYFRSYSARALLELLDREGGGRPLERLRDRRAAWPRLLSLFRLLNSGSSHELLPITRYGGGLFTPGNPASPDPVLRALAALENPANAVSDGIVAVMLELLTRAPVKVRQGRGATVVMAPVDFSQLDTEYIGILYEGLLDYELRRVGDAVPIVFLNLGDQPALPLTRLEDMDDKALAGLVEKLRKSGAGVSPASEESEGEEEEEEGDQEEDGKEADSIAESPESYSSSPALSVPSVVDILDDTASVWRQRAHTWARRAVIAGKLVPNPKGKQTPEKQRAYEAELDRAASALIARIVLPGEYFLVRFGGTRKGSGTFYTKPALARPTVRRTLEPLCYENNGTNGTNETDGVDKTNGTNETNTTNGTGDVSGASSSSHRSHSSHQSHWSHSSLFPRTPAEILELKVCDPACGSGSFLVAGLRYLSTALYESLFAHGWLAEGGTGGPPVKNAPEIVWGPAKDRVPPWFAEALRDVPGINESPDHSRSLASIGGSTSSGSQSAEEKIRARLKRIVVERCLYGVDLDPLAVELARLALWVETMDPYLPFSFLDHKIKCGNALVGCWFDRFQDYPAMAWEREGGDKSHTTGVHFQKEAWTKAIAKAKREIVKPELSLLIRQLSGEQDLFPLPAPPQDILHEAAEVFAELHAQGLLDSGAQATLYAAKFQNNPRILALRRAFDAWCAVWFWPADRLDIAPTPSRFHALPPETRAEIERIAGELRFFHWELEFPDAFDRDHLGFSAIIGNPPWEIQKPNSKEWFSNEDPLYRTYGKQEALAKQKSAFEADDIIERRWLTDNALLKALSNWCKNVGAPFDKKQSIRHIPGFADPAHPFLHQGSADVNTYKLFLELGHALLGKSGREGFIVPSGIYTDRGSTDLRTLFLERCRWEWLFGFSNRKGIFDIHPDYKFCPVIIEKDGRTEFIRAAFMVRNLDAWEEAEQHVLNYPAARIAQFSPKSKAILEIRSERDLAILEKMYQNGVLLGDDGPDGWGIQYACEFHMTNDSKLFPPRPVWEERGYVPDEYGHWLKGKWRAANGLGLARSRDAAKEEPSDPPFESFASSHADSLIKSRDGTRVIAIEDIEDVALPLYEGRMIGQFDFSQKGWVSGKGRTAVWREIGFEDKVIEPQYLMAAETFDSYIGDQASRRLSFMDITSATNMRTMIASNAGPFPFGNSAPVFGTKRSPLGLASLLCAYAYDYTARGRCGGLHLNYFVVEETPLVKLIPTVALMPAASLSLTDELFAPAWLSLLDSLSEESKPSRGSALESVGRAAGSFSGQDMPPVHPSSHSSHKSHPSHPSHPSHLSSTPWRRLWAVTPHERLRLRCILDAVVAHLYGLDEDDFRWILRDCDHPVEGDRGVTNKAFARTLDPKGFWRVDKTQPPELRHTVLSQVAFANLQSLIRTHGEDEALRRFLGTGPDDGWMLPETIRLSDYNLGHDARAHEPHPVASALGPRFYDWQLTQSAEDSWAECRMHAEKIRRIREIGRGSSNPTTPTNDENPSPSNSTTKKPPRLGPQPDLFNNHEQQEQF